MARRQAPVGIACAVIFAAAAVPFCLSLRDQYASSTTAAYDPNDGTFAGAKAAAASRFPQIAATLQARLVEPEFLWQVATAVELSLDPSSDKTLADDSSTKAKVAKLLGPTLRGTADVAGQTLTISVLAEDSLTAKRLADAVMELFIQKELRFEAETYFRLHEAHARFLEDVRGERAKLGPPTSESTLDDDEFIPRLAERVQELDLERRRLVNQIDQPASRTRIRVTVPATYDDVPVKRVRRRAGVALTLAGILLIIILVVYRETRTRYARSSARIMRVTGLPVLAEVSKQSIKAFPEITKEQAIALRSEATAPNARGSAVSAWQSYQAVERAIARVSVGPVILLAVPDGKSETHAFVHNYLAITATDQTYTRLVIDGETRDPMGSRDERRQSPGDLGLFLAGKVSWKEIRLNRTPSRPYDLVFASPEAGDGRAPYAKGLLARLFTSLCKGYGRVFIRAHALAHELENGELVQAATDCLLLVDARTTRLTEVERATRVLGRAKLRGIILIGT